MAVLFNPLTTTITDTDVFVIYCHYLDYLDQGFSVYDAATSAIAGFELRVSFEVFEVEV